MKKLLFVALITLAGGSMAAQDNRGISNDPLSSVMATQDVQDVSTSVGSASTHAGSSGSNAGSSGPDYKAQSPLSLGTPSNDPLSIAAWQSKATTSGTQH